MLLAPIVGTGGNEALGPFPAEEKAGGDAFAATAVGWTAKIFPSRF
jgi:hypothetical protein